jgi:hypothetical protein
MPRSPPLPMFLVVALATCVFLAGCNECSFWERCDGDVIEVCGARGAPDQVVGRKISRIPCEAPNTRCVRVDERFATCVTPTACTPGTPESCSNDDRVSCVEPLDGGAFTQFEPCGTRWTPDGSVPLRCVPTDAGVACTP